MNEFLLNAEQLNSLSPFYFVLGQSLSIESVGTALPKIHPNFRPGVHFDEVLTCEHPNLSFTFDDLSRAHGSLFILGFRGRPIQLKGQFLYFASCNKMVFIGTPSIGNIKQLADFGLTFQDFAIHDSAVDYLFLLQSLQTALADAKRFSDELASQAERERHGLAKFPEESPHPIFRVEKSGVIIYANSASQNLMNHFGVSVGNILPQIWKEALVDGAYRGNWEIEVEVECTGKIYSLSTVPIKGTNYVNVYGRDVTGHKKAEVDLEESRSQSIASAKMASLGEMAGGIAHEINSPLATITTLASQLRELLSLDNSDLTYPKEAAAEIESTAHRIAKIVNGLRSFSRESSLDPFANVSVKNIVQDTLAFCSEKFKHHDIDLIIDDFSQDLVIQCRTSEISQVLLNLLGNARDAVENLMEKWVRLSIRDEKDHVELAVTDSGGGIPKDVVDKLFQPFFTTKEVGKGTGLGLGISRRIVEAHGGSISVDMLSKNTRFVITLPKIQSS